MIHLLDLKICCPQSFTTDGQADRKKLELHPPPLKNDVHLFKVKLRSESNSNQEAYDLKSNKKLNDLKSKSN